MKYKQPNPEIKGWMNPDELQWLYELGQQSKTVVEIGSWFGRSTHAILRGNEGGFTDGAVWAVDTFKGSPSEIKGEHAFAKTGDVYAEFIKNVGHFDNLKTIVMDSQWASHNFKGESLDAVFIDGEHTLRSVCIDLHSWARKVRPGRILCGHDINQDGVPQALRKFFGMVPPPVVGSIWAFVNNGDTWVPM